MKNTFFMIISSFLPMTLVNLFAQSNSSKAQPPQMGQPQGGQPQMRQGQPGQPMMGMGQAQRGASLSQSLDAYSLPAGAITESDIPKIKTVIQQALDKLSGSLKSAGKKADYQTIKSGILAFQDWLKKQGCVSQASSTYDLEAADKYSENIFVTYPGQLPFDIVFKMEGDMKKPYRMLMFVSMVDFLNLASLVENKSIGGVPFPKGWPKDTWSYWEPRL